MLSQILVFILQTIFFLLIGAALLRGYMNWVRVGMTVQPGLFVMAITDWIVKPLRRVLPVSLAKSRIDWASVIAAALLALLYALLLALLIGWLWASGFAPAALLGIFTIALKMLVRVALQTAMVLLIGYVIISWVQPGSPAHSLLARLVEPMLAPLRRVVPTIGGLDLSALVLVILLQIGLMILG